MMDDRDLSRMLSEAAERRMMLAEPPPPSRRMLPSKMMMLPPEAMMKRRMMEAVREREELKDDYRKALELGQVLVAYARVMLVGHGGVGKSSLLHGLMNLPLPQAANSTQLADLVTVRPQQLMAKAIVNDMPWVGVTDSDEINELVGLVMLVTNVARGITESSRFKQFMPKAASYAASTLPEWVSSIKNDIIREVFSRALEVAKVNPHAQAPESEIMINVWDCAGQSVYLDILSAFLTPKTIFMLLYDARKDLDDRCIILSHQHGQVTQSQEQNMSYLEMLFQWMASIHVTLTDESSGSIPDYPRIITVGTHGDDPQVRLHKKEIIEKLSQKCEGKAFTHLVGKGYIVNNRSAGKGDHEDPTFKKLRKEVHQFTSQSSVTIATPVAWVLFRKILQKIAKNQPVLTYEEALEVATSCAIPSASFKSVLKFYHDVAVFLYYDHIPSLNGYVIASPQWLVKQLAKLLALEGFEEVRNPALWKPLRESGILVEPLYKEVWRGSGLPEKSIMDLLEKCLLAAPIDTKYHVHRFPGLEHFVPSALPLCSDDQLSGLQSKEVKGTSLHLLFSTGYVPPGYLTRLAVALSKENKCQISFSHGIYRNQFTFLYGDENNKLDEVTITQHISSVKVNINRSVHRKSHNLPFHLICREVLNTILACSSDIRQWLPSIEISTALTCSSCSSKGHYMEIPPKATTQSILRCRLGKICTLTSSEQYWLTISSKEEGLDLTSSLTRAELQAVGEEVQREGKLQTLAESLEMTIHYNRSIQGVDLLDRWQTEMKQFSIHTRSHLVHHLRCINLDDIANRLKYSQLQLSPTTGLAEVSFVTQDPLTEKDLLLTSRLMGDRDLEELASALCVSDDDLATIQSKFKKKEAQAHQLLYKWHNETKGSKQRLCEILSVTGYHEAAKELQGSDIPKIKDLLRHVKTTRWYRLGLELDIDNHTMQVIEADTKGEHHMTERALTRVFQEWLKTKENPSWSDIDRALRVMGENIAANRL